MIPPIFSACNIPAVKALLKTGTGPLRIWNFGSAPPTPERPYMVWRVVGGSPFNVLDCPPNADQLLTEVSIYANTVSDCMSVAATVRDAIEATHAKVTSWEGTTKDNADTGLFMIRFETLWNVRR